MEAEGLDKELVDCLGGEDEEMDEVERPMRTSRSKSFKNASCLLNSTGETKFTV